MAFKTVLQITQDILNELDGDEVNSINDTVESLQIANIVQTTYEKMSANRDWPYQKQLIQLQGLSDTTRPSHLKIPDNVKKLFTVRYDKHKTGSLKKTFQDVIYLEPDAFLVTINGRDSTATNIVEVTDSNGALILIRNDAAPVYWTSFNDDEIIFDSYDTAVDTTAQGSKTQVIAYVEEPFVLTDSAVPPLPQEAFPALIAEAKATAAFSINQIVNSKAEKDARRQHGWLSQSVFKAKGGIKYTKNYGRRSAK